MIVKLPGKLSANPQTGQLTATFSESPQFPFSSVKLQLHGVREPFSPIPKRVDRRLQLRHPNRGALPLLPMC